MFDLARSRPAVASGSPCFMRSTRRHASAASRASGELLLPHPGDLARELGARAHVLAAQDLVLVELHHPAVVAELRKQRGELLHHRGVVGRQVVQLLQVRGRAGRVLRAARAAASRAGRAAGERAARRTPRSRTCDSVSSARRGSPISSARASSASSVSGSTCATSASPKPGEGLVEILQIAMGHAARPVAGALRACGLRRGLPGRRAAIAALSARRSASGAGLVVAFARGLLEHRQRLVGGSSGEREIEEASARSACPCAAATCAARASASHPIGRGLAARDLPLVEVDDVASGFSARAASRSRSSSASAAGTLVSPASPCWIASRARSARRNAEPRPDGRARAPGRCRSGRAPADRARSTARRGRWS